MRVSKDVLIRIHNRYSGGHAFFGENMPTTSVGMTPEPGSKDALMATMMVGQSTYHKPHAFQTRQNGKIAVIQGP